MAQVSLTSVTKRFGDVMAVDELTLDVEEREFLVLLGPSGCGKSTLLRLVAGLEEPTSGTVSIAGQVVNDREPKDRDVAMVFQSYALYPHKTARQNIEFPLRSRGVERGERARLVAEAAESLDITAVLDRKPRAMSGGQRQRVALAGAIVRRPAVFLMDEPLSNLDAKLRVQTRAELIELHQRLGATVLYVTHDQVEAMTMGTRVAIMLGGVMQQVGPPQEVYDRPANVFVAQFTGSPPMNVLPGRLVDGVAPGALVGVRPEHLMVAAPTEAGLTGKVRLVESLGHERHVLVVLDDATQVIARLDADDAVPVEGDTVTLRPLRERLHLFDATTGARLRP